jgi:hypothetical protein
MFAFKDARAHETEIAGRLGRTAAVEIRLCDWMFCGSSQGPKVCVEVDQLAVPLTADGDSIHAILGSRPVATEHVLHCLSELASDRVMPLLATTLPVEHVPELVLEYAGLVYTG